MEMLFFNPAAKFRNEKTNRLSRDLPKRLGASPRASSP